MTNQLYENYLWWRKRGNSPFRALKNSRKELANGDRRFTAHGKPCPPCGKPFDGGKRFVDDLNRAGMRLVGLVQADAQYRYELFTDRSDLGWYTDQFQDSTYQAAVVQIPGRDGAARLYPAYVEHDNGGYVVDFSAVHIVLGRGKSAETDHYNGLRTSSMALDCAQAADDMARRAAEEARQYDRAWRAGSEWARLKNENINTKNTLRMLFAERARLRSSGCTTNDYPHVWEVLESEIKRRIWSIKDNKEKMQALADGDGGNEYCFYGDEQSEAFNEGAGEPVLK